MRTKTQPPKRNVSGTRKRVFNAAKTSLQYSLEREDGLDKFSDDSNSDSAELIAKQTNSMEI